MRAEKKSIADELGKLLDDNDYVILVDYCGLNMEQMSDLRGKLKDSSSKMQVIKNAYFKRAWLDSGYEDGVEGALDGPTAAVAGTGDVCQAAKILSAFKRANTRPEIKGGILEGKTLSKDDVIQMASLPAREVMLGITVGTIAAPMSGLVGVLSQKLASLVYVLKAAQEKKQ